jgi:L-ascorbate metabolism protein UlaG (beta-lactamase superfamily)
MEMKNWFRTELDVAPGASYLSGTPLSFSRGGNAAVFIGHATVLVRLDGQTFLTDPLYLQRLYILRRHSPPGVPFQDLPTLDFLLLSHGHLDHMDLKTLDLFPRHLPVVLPAKLEPYLQEIGFTDVRPLCWGEKTVVGSLLILALPAKHFTGRSLYETRSLPQSYLIQGNKSVFFGGDSALTTEFATIGSHYPIDLAFLPIGHYRPSSFRRGHMSPEDALQAMEMLGAKKMVPIHWGVFRLSLEAMEEPPRRFLDLVAERKMNPRAVLLQPGERVRF